MSAAMTGWDPVQYLRFDTERLRPALDLLARIGGAAQGADPALVVDLGCGAGNVTALLCRRFPTAHVLGVDASPAMLEAARLAAPAASYTAADIAGWAPPVPPEVIFSNAALHWLADHARLLPRLLGLLAPGGWLAVQIPAMHDAPLRRLQYAVAEQGPWAAALDGIASAPPILAPEQYWDLLRPGCATLDIWETSYLHALSGPDAVAEWAAGSSLRPFLDRLDAPMGAAFRAAYAAALRPHYPPREDGTTLLAFRRLFLVARRG